MGCRISISALHSKHTYSYMGMFKFLLSWRTFVQHDKSRNTGTGKLHTAGQVSHTPEHMLGVWLECDSDKNLWSNSYRTLTADRRICPGLFY